MKKLIWLDDCRDPFENPDWLVFSPIGADVEVIWLKSYTEFTNYLNTQGLPDGICFDHDLGDPMADDNGMSEKTGYDCAKFLVNYCQDNKLKLPSYNSQSSNPVGRDNIINLLNNFKKYGISSNIYSN